MNKHFKKIRKDVMELAMLVASKKQTDVTEEDLDILAEAMDILNDLYEELYDNVFVEIDEN